MLWTVDGPRLARAAVERDEVETRVERGGDLAAPERLPGHRVDGGAFGGHVLEPAAVAPETDVGEIAARGLEAHRGTLREREPVGDLLQVLEGAADELRFHQPWRVGNRLTHIAKGHGGELGIAFAAVTAFGDHLVGAAVEEQIEPAVLVPGLAGRAELSGHAVDDPERGSLRARSADCVAAEHF